jgi:hypothetical protein
MSEAQAPTPSLHDIANMPFSETLGAIRKYYDPNFERHSDAGGEGDVYTVQITYQIRADRDDEYRVIATSEEEAIEKAKDQLYLDEGISEYDIDDAIVISGPDGAPS